MQKLAAAKLKPVISEAVKKEAYAKKLKDESYGFLKTRAFYLECLRQAQAKWGWANKKLGD